MKFAFSLFALALTVTFAQAGGFGGPPPFTNGSPLVSGVDGSYQGIARGKNLTGSFRFTYSGGRQTSSPSVSANGIISDPYNDYIFFVDGLAYRGITQADVNDGTISGVLDNGAANVPNAGTTNTSYLQVFTFLAGYFNGSMDNNSPVAAFSGNGSVSVSNFTQGDTTTPGSVSPAFTRAFKFKGVRNSLSTSSGSSSNSTTGQ
jgi:hypothetical protein